MITKINKIKNLGHVFRDYRWKVGIPNFKEVNLIYGWNGSGKTTLSRFFDVLAGHNIENIEYEVEDSSGDKFRESDPYTRSIRVFNQEYIQNNLSLNDQRSQANTISILLGEENKELVRKIESDEKDLMGDPSDKGSPGKLSEKILSEKELSQLTKSRSSKFTEIAKVIGTAIGGSALRNYKKNDAEKEFAALVVDETLSDSELEQSVLLLKQDTLPKLIPFKIDRVVLPSGEDVDIIDLVVEISTKAAQLLETTAESEVITKLSKNKDISDWVEEGVALHKKHNSEICEYCLQEIPISRIESLAKHFSDEDKKIKDSIDSLLEGVETIEECITKVEFPDSARLYKSLQKEYEITVEEYKSNKKEFLSSLATLSTELTNKKSKTTDQLKLQTVADISSLVAKIGDVNSKIDEHNSQTEDFDKTRIEAESKIKQHYLSSISGEVKDLDRELNAVKTSITDLEKEIENIEGRIRANRAKISSQHKAADVINENLRTFLGHGELEFIPDIEIIEDAKGLKEETVVGYKIMRGGKPAQYLSEGEKTAIVFVHFVVHLNASDFNINDGIIVIDDPVSSLDSNSLYQAHSFLKNSVKGAHQVFIFTHNFEFLRLLINWRKHGGGAGYYMIKNEFPDDVRSAYIDKMDDELHKYESEYHYLFKKLKELKSSQDDTIAKAYPIPNIARKVWESFLMYSVPNSKTPYKKMEDLKSEKFDAQKLDAIYKFTNDQSHITGAGFNPALVPEARKVVNEIFEMMNEISPRHYKVLNEATN